MTLNRRLTAALVLLLATLGGCAAHAEADTVRLAIAGPLPAIAFDLPATPPAGITAVVDAAFAAQGPDAPRAVLVVHRGRLLAERFAPGTGPVSPVTGFVLAGAAEAATSARDWARLGQRYLDDGQRPGEPTRRWLAVVPSHDLVVVRFPANPTPHDADELHRLVDEVTGALPRVTRPETPTRERAR